jgi:7-cyano-7-deazaguanine synthase in queuosine biosynthesis
MTTYRLAVPADFVRRPAITDLVWGTTEDRSSFLTRIRPNGAGFEIGDPIALDLVRLAIAVYVVDRTASRPRDWQRDLVVDVPVSDVTAWNDRAAGLAGLLDFMTGDRWEFVFRADPGARPRLGAANQEYDRVCLFSGGADSFVGAARSRQEVERLLLVGHHDSKAVLGVQNRAIRNLMRLAGHQAWYRFVQVARRREQIVTGERFGTESTSRTRSFLFMALGLAAAHSSHARTLWVPENGWVSINPPVTGERRGALSTRTTHPGLLDELVGMVQSVGIDATIENPWQTSTKGEVLSWFRANAAVDDDAVSAILSATHSCARSNAQYEGFSPLTHCGVCFACLVRRAAFVAAEIPDQTEYIELLLQANAQRRAAWLTAARRQDYAAVRTAIARGGFDIEDVLAMDLPRRYRPDAALDLANRGLAELEQVRLQ